MDHVKTPIAVVILAALLCALLCGCGGKDAETGAPAVVTPKVLSANGAEHGTPAPSSAPTPEPSSEPKPAPSSAPTPTPTPEPTPQPTPEPTPEQARTWFETSGLRFSSQGELTVRTDLSTVIDGADNVPLDCDLTVSKVEAPAAGIKVITATLEILPYLERYEDGTYMAAWAAMYGFLDQYTGRMIVCEIEDGDVVDSTIKYNGESYDVSLEFDYVISSSYYDLGDDYILFPAQLRFQLTCPEDYDGAAFFVSGCSSDDFDVYVADPVGHYDTFDNSGYDFCVVDGR